MYSVEISEEAETGCRAIMRICADWESVSTPRDDSDLLAGRNVSPTDRLDVETSTHALSYISRMVAECEHFAFRRIREIAVAHVSTTQSAMLTHLFEKNKSTLDSTWANVLNFARECLSVDIRSVSEWAAFENMIDLRNASAHGRGELTDKQVKNMQEVKKMAAKLAAAGFIIEARKIYAPRGGVRDCARICRRFILQVDEATRDYQR